mmetsp:Transcript_9588/g.30398  ORF Transcript_9588/g.30398 Transcript_9588/m.30398 type:complete len:214 (-) Transcript_9588:63-704(-)
MGGSCASSKANWSPSDSSASDADNFSCCACRYSDDKYWLYGRVSTRLKSAASSAASRSCASASADACAARRRKAACRSRMRMSTGSSRRARRPPLPPSASASPSGSSTPPSASVSSSTSGTSTGASAFSRPASSSVPSSARAPASRSASAHSSASVRRKREVRPRSAATAAPTDDSSRVRESVPSAECRASASPCAAATRRHHSCAMRTPRRQ